MEDGFTLTFRDDFIHIEHSDRFVITPANLKKVYDAMGAACRNFACYRVLSESPSPPPRQMSITAAYDSAGMIADRCPGLRMAIVIPDYITDQVTDMFKTAAYNQGLIIEFFTDREYAVDWLCKSNPAPDA